LFNDPTPSLPAKIYYYYTKHTGNECEQLFNFLICAENINLDFTFPPRYPLGHGLDEYDVENELYDGEEPITLYSAVPAITWSTHEVVECIR
jgi:hypothetical protein